MKKSVYLLVLIVFLLLMGAAIAPVAACEDPDHDIDCACDGQPTKIISVLDLGEFTISNDIMSSTPYWTFLIGGKKDKKALLDFIKKREVPAKQRNEWKKILKKLWKKYPTDFQDGVIVIAPDKKTGSSEIQLTDDEQRILAEIGDEMGKAMEESLNEQLTIKWGDEHSTLISMVCIDEGFSDYATIAADWAPKPDSNDPPGQHQYYHYFNPNFGTGGAPVACEESANQARDYYRDGQTYDAFRLLGYSSHFLVDVGNPMHTGAEGAQIADYFTRNMHKAYEMYVTGKWSTWKLRIGKGGPITASSPSELTKGLATYSNWYLGPLKWRIDVNFRNNGYFDLSQDSVIDSMSINCLEMSYRYARGLVKYATAVPPSYPVIPLCQAGIPFDSGKYPQNAPRSDPMTFTCYWDGTGYVYTSGDRSTLTGIYADDGYSIVISPSGTYFETPTHWAIQHPPVELTSGMTRGLNTITLTVENWRGLSMSYGSSTGVGTDQEPYIIKTYSPMARMSFPVVSFAGTSFTQNESMDNPTGSISDG